MTYKVKNIFEPNFNSTEPRNFRFEGRVHFIHPSKMTLGYWEGAFVSTQGKDKDKKPTMLTNDNIVPSGSILRNTAFIVGIVINMADDTLIQRDVKKPRTKQSVLYLRMHTYSKYLIMIILLGTGLMTAGHHYFTKGNSE